MRKSRVYARPIRQRSVWAGLTVTALVSLIVTSAGAMQNQPPPGTPFQYLNNATFEARRNDPAAVRRLTDGIIDVVSPVEVPSKHWIRDRVYQAEFAFRKGTQKQIHESDAVAAFNDLASDVGAPRWAVTNVRQVHVFRFMLKPELPHLVGRESTGRNPFDFKPTMSPAEAILVSTYLGRSKLTERSFQVMPDEWLRRAHEAHQAHKSRPDTDFDDPGPTVTVSQMTPLESSVLVLATKGHLNLDKPGGQRLVKFFARLGFKDGAQ